MTTDPDPAIDAIEINDMALPVASEKAAVQVIAAMADETLRLYANDRAAGLEWASELGDIAVEADQSADPEALGRIIAANIRRQLVRTAGQARGSSEE